MTIWFPTKENTIFAIGFAISYRNSINNGFLLSFYFHSQIDKHSIYHHSIGSSVQSALIGDFSWHEFVILQWRNPNEKNTVNTELLHCPRNNEQQRCRLRNITIHHWHISHSRIHANTNRGAHEKHIPFCHD